MKKTTLFKTVLLLCALIVGSGSAWADDELYYTLDGKETASGNAYANASTVKQNDMTWSVVANTEMSPWRVGGKSLTNVDREIKSTTAMGAAITQVKVDVGSTGGSLTVNSIKLVVASDADFNTQLDEIEKESNSTSNTLTFTPTSGTEWAKDSYYKIVFNVTRTSNSGNGYVQFNKADFYKAASSAPSSAATFANTTPSINFPATTTYSQTATTAAGYTGTVTYSITANTAGATLEGSTVTVTKEGSVTVKATAPAITGWSASEATYTLTVTDTRADAGISFAENAQETTLGSDYAGQALTNTNSLSPIAWTSTNTDVATVNASTGAVTTKAAGVTTIKAAFAGDLTYKAAEVQYTLTVNKKNPGISFSVAEAEAKIGKTFVAPTLNNPNDLTLAFTSTNTSVATVDATGAVTILAEGTTTIKATFTENDEYLGAVVQYVLNVVTPGKVEINFNNNALGVSGNYEQKNSLSYTANGIQFDLSIGTNNQHAPRVDGADYSSTKYLRLYTDNTMTITAPGNLKFKTITFNFNKGSIEYEGKKSYSTSSTTWSETAANSVVFTCTASAFINSISFTYDSEDIVISTSKYATYCSYADLDFSETGITVYTAVSDGTKVNLTEVEDGIVPAGEGVVLYSTTAKTYNVPVTANDATDYESLSNEMIGVKTHTQVNETADTKTNYILSKEDAGVGFYLASGGYLAANKAYLSTSTPAAAAAREFLPFAESETTGISAMHNSQCIMHNEYFDLQGRRVAQPTKGPYIVNGKKVIVK